MWLCAEAELAAEVVPEPETERNGNESERPETPGGCAVGEHRSAIAHATEGTEGDVGAVADQAETCEEPQYVAAAGFECCGKQPCREGEQHTPDRTGPDDDEGRGIVTEVRSGNVERMDIDLFDDSAGDPRAENVAGLVKEQHQPPR